MRNGWFAGAVVALILLGAAGCATTPPAAQPLPADVYLEGSNAVRFFDEQAPLAELPRLLKRAGVSPACTIAVHIADTRNQQLMSQVILLLREAGYRRVAFVGNRHAEATVR